ncbi:MAG: hypothetical protein AAF558_05975, partial [Verrucomicrobiota bacterium]
AITTPNSAAFEAKVDVGQPSGASLSASIPSNSSVVSQTNNLCPVRVTVSNRNDSSSSRVFALLVARR